MRFGFVGPAYQSPTPLADAEQLINWKVQQVESPNARVPYILLPDPGLSIFATLGMGTGFPNVRGLETFSGRTFAVSGTTLLELTGAGAVTNYGDNTTTNNNMVDDGLPVTMVVGGTVGGSYPTQLLISSGGTITVFSLVSNTYQALTTPPANVLMVEFLSGFFIALTSNNDFAVSNPEDATTWPGLSISQVQVFSDQLIGMRVSNQILWIFGATRAVGYYLSGAAIFPFDVYSGATIECGILAQFSTARVATRQGTTVAWLGGDERGGAVVYALNGFTQKRISDHGLETWMSLHTVTDAVGMARHDEEGNNFYELWFPTANTTWTLDVDQGFWHQRSSLVKGVPSAHRQRCHTYNFGMHLVGDRTTGNIYSMSSKYFTDNVGIGMNNPIIRTRVGPSIATEGGRLTVPINEFQVDFEMGLGPMPPLTDGFGNPRQPYAVFSYSPDFGKTWGPDRLIPCGQAGQFTLSARDSRLGSWHSWTPRVVVSDPIPWRIADAYTNSTQDQKERLAKQFAKIT